MDETTLRNAFSVWRDRHERKAWKPVVREGDDEVVSHFGGSPMMKRDEPWPACATCGEPLRLFLQVDLRSLPPGFDASAGPAAGLLQLLYCSTDDGGCETWRPFSGTHVVRILNEPHHRMPHPAGVEAFPTKAIDGWNELVDFPHPEDHRELGVDYSYDFKARRVTVRCPEIGLEIRDLPIDMGVAELVSNAEPGDKLGGWPAWVQGPEYPACPTCGARMGLVFQLDSEDNLPTMFGDLGCGHITQCPTHRDVLAFGWACG
jgi:uncharacterized protein YwqG